MTTAAVGFPLYKALNECGITAPIVYMYTSVLLFLAFCPDQCTDVAEFLEGFFSSVNEFRVCLLQVVSRKAFTILEHRSALFNAIIKLS